MRRKRTKYPRRGFYEAAPMPTYAGPMDGVGYPGWRGSDDVDLGGYPGSRAGDDLALGSLGDSFGGEGALDQPTLVLPLPGAPEPINSLGDCGCGCNGSGGCGNGMGDVSEAGRIAYGAGALVALLFGTRAHGAVKWGSYAAAAYLAYVSYSGSTTPTTT